MANFSVMADVPNPVFDTNGDPFSGAVLKAFLPGTTTALSIAIDEDGGSPQASITYNAQGKLEVSGNEVLPFIDRKQKWGIFANAADAAANTPFYMGPFDDVPSTIDALVTVTKKPVEEITLTSGQTTVIFTTVDVNKASIYFTAPSGDRGRLFKGVDYTVTSTTQIELVNSQPSGTKCVADETTLDTAITSASDNVKNFASLGLALADTDLLDGDALNIKERVTGKAGGAIWDVVLLTTVTPNSFDKIASTGSPTLALKLRVDGLLSLLAFGGVADGATSNTAALEAASVVTNAVLLNGSKGVFNFATVPTLTSEFTTFITGKSALTGITAVQSQAALFDAGAAKGYPVADELRFSGIEIVSGTIRQEVPVSVSGITSVSTTATVTQTAHGFSNGDSVDIRGVVEDFYNGLFVIANVTTNTYEYTLAAPSTSPATGTIKAHRPAIWNWIKDSLHEPIGVVDSSPVTATTSVLPIPFTKTYSRVLSFIAAPDEQLANTIGMTIGGSVGVSLAQLKASANLTLAGELFYDGADFVFTAGAGQGQAGIPVAVEKLTYSAGTLTISHDWLGSSDVAVSGNSQGGVIIPFEPVIRTMADTFTALNFKDGVNSLYAGAESTRISTVFRKTFKGGMFLDGGNGSANSYKLYNGNIWFYGIFEL